MLCVLCVVVCVCFGCVLYGLGVLGVLGVGVCVFRCFLGLPGCSVLEASSCVLCSVFCASSVSSASSAFRACNALNASSASSASSASTLLRELAAHEDGLCRLLDVDAGVVVEVPAEVLRSGPAVQREALARVCKCVDGVCCDPSIM